MRSEEVKKRNLAITSMSATLLATVAISMITTDNAFARNERYASDVSQAASEKGQETCEECFDILSSDEQNNFLERVRQELFIENPPTTFEEFCAALLALDEDDLEVAFEDISIILVEMDLDEATQASIFRCLSRAV
jgi:hypothetical protein